MNLSKSACTVVPGDFLYGITKAGSRKLTKNFAWNIVQFVFVKQFRRYHFVFYTSYYIGNGLRPETNTTPCSSSFTHPSRTEKMTMALSHLKYSFSMISQLETQLATQPDQVHI